MEKSESSWIIPTQDKLCCVEFSPYDWSATLLAAGTSSRLYVYQCQFSQNENPEMETFSCETLREFNHGTGIRVIAWSPETSLTVTPKSIKLATAGGDNNIRLISSTLQNDDSILVIEGHTDYINSLTFDPEQGTQLASTSDDYTCRIWNMDGTLRICLTLSSPGMSVCWHKDDPGKIMVAQKNGIIRFYNLVKEQPIMSLDCGQTPLMSADWCPHSNLQVGGVAASYAFVWDTSRSSQPQEINQIHTDGALQFRWARNNQNIYATSGRPKHQIKVVHFKASQIPICHSLSIGSGLSWHSKLSLLAAVGDRKVHLWKFDAF